METRLLRGMEEKIQQPRVEVGRNIRRRMGVGGAVVLVEEAARQRRVDVPDGSAPGNTVGR